MVEIVHNLKKLERLLSKTTLETTVCRSKVKENSIEAIKARATQVTVGDLIKHK